MLSSRVSLARRGFRSQPSVPYTRIGAGRSGYTAAVIPVIAMVFSTFFEDYVWTLPALVGMAFVLTGNVLVMWKR